MAVIKKRNPTDATMRNVRAHAFRLRRLEADVKALIVQVQYLVRLQPRKK